MVQPESNFLSSSPSLLADLVTMKFPTVLLVQASSAFALRVTVEVLLLSSNE